MARTVLNDSKLSDVLWVQVVEIAMHIHNIGMHRRNNVNTSYELKNGRQKSSTSESLEANAT